MEQAKPGPDLPAIDSHWTIFLDRDGTICEEMGYMNHLRRFSVLRGQLARLHEASGPRPPRPVRAACGLA